MKNIVILVSGSGSNLQNIIDSVDRGEIEKAQIILVLADRECFALQRAENHGIDNYIIERGKNLSKYLMTIIPENTDLIVLAGFLSILNKDFCENFKGKIINIHPSLLPKFGGKGMWGHHVHEAVLASNEKLSGVTVHFVTPNIDEGEIILTGCFDIEEDETLETLALKVAMIEQDLYPSAIDLVLNDPYFDKNSYVFN